MSRPAPGLLPAFWQKVLTLSAGSLSAQLIGLLSLLINARLYSDAELGVAGLYIFSVMLFAVMVNGGYEQAVMLPAADAEARALLRLSLGFAAAVSAALGLLALAAGLLPGDWLGIGALGRWRFLIPLGVLLEGCYQPMRVYLNRQGAYKRLALSRLLRSVLTAGLSGALGWAEAGFPGLILGWIAGQAASLLALAGLEWKGLLREKAPLRAAARAYADFPRYGMISAWLNSAARFLPIYLLSPAFGSAMAGQFAQADRILSLPASLLAMALGEVFYAQARQAAQDSPQALAALTRQTFRRLSLPALLMLLVLLLFGRPLFRWVLGSAWDMAGLYAQFLAPWFSAVFIAGPLSYLIDIRRQLRAFLLFNLLSFACRFAALQWACQAFYPGEAVLIFAATGTFFAIAQMLWMLRLGTRLPP
jgi:O-antigen/teichoic acid export membrane protein